MPDFLKGFFGAAIWAACVCGIIGLDEMLSLSITMLFGVVGMCATYAMSDEYK